ncbi:uncharacterized protein LOC128555047 [Mercenaria mercenaria]|uniref:uncharacterized protein LOC128555047 n=1 Tax=Mercenaria mercenaria TaxID=6596 RepID=UPI00234F566B|nr:uncharacterized protein LOC128555047 [Mercenaria mercenaria]
MGDFNFKRGSVCIRHTANAACLQYPERVTTTKLRKYLATVSQIFNLSTAELSELARHMGHELSVHKIFYRLQDDVIELAKISRLLIAVEEGKAASFAGCTLDDINIADIPEEDAIDEPDEDDETDDDNMLSSYDVDETVCDTPSSALNRDPDQLIGKTNRTEEAENNQTEEAENNRVEEAENNRGEEAENNRGEEVEKSRTEEARRTKCQRKTWTGEEKNALTELVTKLYADRKPPRKSEILKCQIQHPVLKNLNWLNIKYQVWALAQKKSSAEKKVIQELFP